MDLDLIPGYNGYHDTEYQFPENTAVTNDCDNASPTVTGVNGDTRQRTLSGDRVVILPRRPSQQDTLSPGPDPSSYQPPPAPGPPPHHHPGGAPHHPDPSRRHSAPEWRVPPHYNPESLYPGKFIVQ